MSSISTQTLIDTALRGETTDGYQVVIYWDSEGPAYRIVTTDGDGNRREESGGLEFLGWSSEDTDGYELAHYFRGDRGYCGPDCDGVYPLMSAW